jgi:hypothetical protein
LFFNNQYLLMCTFLLVNNFFNAIVLLPRYPPSDVMTILHSLSIIRLATAEAENPQNNGMRPIRTS